MAMADPGLTERKEIKSLCRISLMAMDRQRPTLSLPFLCLYRPFPQIYKCKRKNMGGEDKRKDEEKEEW